MSDIEILERLVATWKAKWLLEEETLPEVICRDHPELLAEFLSRIGEIKLLDELLGEFEERRSAGESPTPEAVCRDHPHLIDRFQAEVKKLDLFDSVFGETEAEESGDAEPVGVFCDGRYHVEGVLARGGQGIIYTAVDRELGRTVVVKGPGRRGLGRESLIRLEQEAHTTGRLEHPGVVPIYGFGRDTAGKPYYAMKFIDGETLSAAIKRFHLPQPGESESSRRTLDFQKLLRDFVLVCRTVAYAHSRGIVHRDIKPINIMLGKFGEVWVVDWGLAKRLGESGPASVSKANGGQIPAPPIPPDPDAATIVISAGDDAPARQSTSPHHWISQTFEIKGTLAYMSPEQAEGRNRDVGPASDIYSLGATMYELLTGAPPVSGGVAKEMLARVIAGEIVPPREMKPDLPPPLAAICTKAMRRMPAGRYASAADLADEIERWLADEPVSAWPDPWTVRAGRWLRRHRTVMTGAAAAVLVGLVGLGLLAAQQAVAKNRLDQKNSQLNAANKNLDQKNLELNKTNVELENANRKERAATKLAQDNEQEAKNQEELAKRRENAERLAKEEAKQLLYFSKTALARSEWLANNMRRSRQVLEGCDESRRGWEWRFLNRLLQTEVKKLDASWPVNCISRSQNGRVIAAGRKDGGVAVWIELLKPGELLHVPKEISFRPEGQFGFDIEVVAVAVSPSGKLLAAASRRSPSNFNPARQAGEVRVCDAVSGAIEFSIPLDAGALAFSPDGKLLAVGTASTKITTPLQAGEVELWDVAAKKRLHSSVVGQGPVSSVAFSPSGTHLAAAGTVGPVKVWALKEGEAPLHDMALKSSGNPHCLAFSTEGNQLAVGNASGGIDVWNLKALREKDENLETRLSLVGHTGQVRSLAMHPTRPILASASYDRTLKIWSTESGKEHLTLRGHEDLVTSVVFNPAGTQLISGSQDGNLKFWQALEDQEAYSRPGQACATSGDGRIVATTGSIGPGPFSEGAKSVWVWDAETGRQLREFSGHKGAIHCVALSDDGKFAASGSGILRTGEALLWEVETGKVLQTLESQAGDIKRVALGPDGKILATYSEGNRLAQTPGELKLWSLETGKPLYSVIAAKGEPANLAFSRSGRYLLAAVRRGPVRLLDARTGHEVLILTGDRHHAAALHPDEKLVVTTGGNEHEGGKIWAWQVESGELAFEFSGHSNTVLGAGFSRDGSRLATAGADGSVRIWDFATRQEILNLPHGGEANDAVFGGPNDETLVSSSGSFFFSGYSRIWRAPPYVPKE